MSFAQQDFVQKRNKIKTYVCLGCLAGILGETNWDNLETVY